MKYKVKDREITIVAQVESYPDFCTFYILQAGDDYMAALQPAAALIPYLTAPGENGT